MIAEKKPWTICPSCGVGPGSEHDPQCPRGVFKFPRYRAGLNRVQDPRFKDGVFIGDKTHKRATKKRQRR